MRGGSATGTSRRQALAAAAGDGHRGAHRPRWRPPRTQSWCRRGSARQEREGIRVGGAAGGAGDRRSVTRPVEWRGTRCSSTPPARRSSRQGPAPRPSPGTARSTCHVEGEGGGRVGKLQQDARVRQQHWGRVWGGGGGSRRRRRAAREAALREQAQACPVAPASWPPGRLRASPEVLVLAMGSPQWLSQPVLRRWGRRPVRRERAMPRQQRPPAACLYFLRLSLPPCPLPPPPARSLEFGAEGR